MRIVLVGMMGSGKSSVGRALAARTGWPFHDNDALIEGTTGRTAQELAGEGEAAPPAGSWRHSGGHSNTQPARDGWVSLREDGSCTHGDRPAAAGHRSFRRSPTGQMTYGARGTLVG